MKGDHKTYEVPKRQTDATLDQAAPVINTYYTILNTVKNARIHSIKVNVNTIGEDINIKVTIDGVALTSQTISAVAGTSYFARWAEDLASEFYLDTTDYAKWRAFLTEGRSIKIEIQKTTANGAGNLQGRVKYSKW